MEKSRKVRRIVNKATMYFLYALLIVQCISTLIPLVWMVFTAGKGYVEYYDNPFLWPKKWRFENFELAFKNIKLQVREGKKVLEYGVLDMAGTSVIYAFLSSGWGTMWTALVAYVLAKYKFKGGEFIYMLGIIIWITPIIGSTPSAMLVKKALGIYDNLVLLVLTNVSTAFAGFNFLLLYGSFKRLPWSYAEAAFMDGAGHFTVLLKVFLPMMMPTCMVLFVLGFLGAWNDYGTFLVWLPSSPNLAYGVYKFQLDMKSFGGNICQVMAGFAMISVPTAVLYLCSQKLIVDKFQVGGLKG
ncbi:MAG: carbohydrate ABC transporter permease [Clostridia bacterium]|nr:carbohydrate ABC transporter permease [Clostridia bacterium]